MNNPQTISKESMAAFRTTGKGYDRFIGTMYVLYYLHMIVLHILAMEPQWFAAVTETGWLRHTMMVFNLSILFFSIYALFQNKHLANWFMERMPAWMLDGMERMPSWMSRWMNHTAMRIMMIAMDIMLIGMCYAFIRAVIRYPL